MVLCLSLLKVTIIFMTVLQCMAISLTIPLTYAVDPYQQNKKYPIVLSFNTSETITPFRSPYIPLYNYNLSL